MRKNELASAFCMFLTLALVVLMITLLALTVNREVSQTEYVVPYNTFNCEFDAVKEQGRYTTDVGVKFLTFPRVLTDLKTGEIACLSSDKVSIDLKLKIQYRLRKKGLVDIVLEGFSTRGKHVKFLERMAESSVLNSCLDYTAEEFYSKRAEVDAHMFTELQNDINDHEYAADIEFFQLNEIGLPDELVDVIVEKQGIAQEIITAGNERVNALITADTNYIAVEQSAQVISIEANNTANILMDAAFQTEDAIISQWYNKAVAYAAVAESLNLNEKQFLEYLEAELFRRAIKSVTE